jgi:hypothetical protein
MEISQGTLLVSFVFRIIGMIYCYRKAGDLKRNTTGWGAFGFIAPILAMIWIQFIKPKMI